LVCLYLQEEECSLDQIEAYLRLARLGRVLPGIVRQRVELFDGESEIVRELVEKKRVKKQV
jgi:hypothetical protein